MISADIHGHIRSRLNDAGKTHNVKILFAAESGSRAWGFPSVDSDYDVRFVYIRPYEDYLSVLNYRDVIETPDADDPFLGVPLDMKGWDLRKALQLALKSNPTLIEWLASPIRYSEMRSSLEALHHFVLQSASANVLTHHYDRPARHLWEEINSSSSAVEIKSYFYALRQSFALLWVRAKGAPPPMNIIEMMDGMTETDIIRHDVEQLIARKAIAKEKDAVERIPALDNFLGEIFKTKTDRPHYSASSTLEQEANRLFRDLIKV